MKLKIRIIDSLRIRILFIVLLVVISIAGLALYSWVERRRLVESIAEESALRLTHIVSVENAHVLERTSQLLASISSQSDSCEHAAPACYSKFPEIIKDSSLYANLGFADPDGKIIYSVLPVNNPGLLTNSPFFYQALTGNGIAAGDYRFSSVTGRSSVYFGYPVRESKGKLTGALFAEVDLSWFSMLINDLSLPTNGVFLLLDRDGVVLSMHPADNKWLGKPVPASMRAKVLAGSKPGEMFESGELNGKQYLFSSSLVGIETAGGNLYSCVGFPRETVFAETDLLLKRNFLLLIIIGSAIFTVAWIGGDLFISRKIYALLDTSNRLASGDLKARTGLSNGAGEFNRLAQAFDDMAESLERRDIELRKTSDSLWRSESEKALILDSMSEFVIYVDTEMKLVWANKAALKSAGLDANHRFGIHCFDMLHLKKEPCEGCPVIEAIKSGWSRTGRMTTHDGKTWFIQGNPVHGLNGKVVGAVAVALDITEREEAAQALSESEERFRQLFEQNEDAIMLLRQKTSEIIDVNPAAISLYGYTREELGRYGYYLLMPPKELDEFQSWLSRVAYGESILIDRRDNIRKDGARIIVSYRFKYIRMLKDDVIYCSVRDISERVRIEEDTKLLQAKLIQANKMTSLGMLVSGIAHEINNPNNYILTNASYFYDAWNADILPMLEDYHRDKGEIAIGGLSFEEAKKDIPRMLSGIAYGSRRIKKIIDDLRDFARQDKAGQYGRIDLSNVLSISTSIIGQQIKRYTDLFHAECVSTIPRARGNAQQIEQVLINIIINALQSLPDRKHGVWVSLAPDPDPEFVVIKVRDEGNGMTEDVLERITEPFFSTKLETGGTGLGLSISSSIIKEHGGTMEFESNPGRGTTVTVKLPVYKD